MKKNSIDSFSLEGLLAKRGIPLKENNEVRSAIDILEDLYLLNPRILTGLFYEIGEEEDFGNNIFEEARNAN